MAGDNPVSVNGFVLAATKPVEAAVGAGEPHGKVKTCQADAVLLSGFAGCVQFKVTALNVSVFVVTDTGFLQFGGGSQVMFATQPGLFTEPSLLNTKVKHPSALDEVNGPGIVAPQYEPAKPPGTLAGGFALAIKFAGTTAFPS